MLPLGHKALGDVATAFTLQWLILRENTAVLVILPELVVGIGMVLVAIP